MKGKLYKAPNSDMYSLTVDGKLFADTEGGPLMAITNKLSVKNCIDIKNGYDLDKLAYDFAKYHSIYPTAQDDTEYGFKNGFNKAIELNKDKVFTLEDMGNLWDFCVYNKGTFAEFTQPILQPTEIDVEIEMKKVVDETKVIGAVKGVKGCGDKITTYKSVPKLDKDGCLILKKI
jgi:hypothetical protein